MRANPYAHRVLEMARNLRHIHATETTAADIALGAPWYDDSHRIMREWSDTYGQSIAVCAAVTAAVSPQCNWQRNLIIADDILAERAVSVGGALHVNIAKARTLLSARESDTRTVFKSGPKVYNFSRNLAGDYSVVTVDTHATQAALCDVEVTVHLRQATYDAFASAYALAADSLGYEPAVFQSIIWHTWKRMFPPTVKIRRRAQWEPMSEMEGDDSDDDI